ncbi:MAG TPA: hypothetical protein ENK18_22060 [Deltaproteobacteria bacterium]|nr:hypothetical protein [Deltaproteobacteria bacterium]
MLTSLLLLGCWGQDAYIVEGTVIEVRGEHEVVLDHKDVPGLMAAMVMPFQVSSPELLEGLEPGHKVVARYLLSDQGGALTKIRITGQGPVPQLASGPIPLKPGILLPRIEIPTHDGGSLILGEGQGHNVAVTFLYTRCPIPEMCPALVARLQALDAQLPDGDEVQLLAITLDPEHDTPGVLARYAEQVGASPRWRFGRLPEAQLDDLAMYAGLPVLREGDQIVHALRLIVLSAQGRLIERYDDARFPADRVLTQLRTGEPVASSDQSGTTTPP